MPYGAGAGAVGGPGSDGTTLMPQMSDEFLDRLFALAGSANDVSFRQNLTDDLVEFELELAQAEREEAYYTRAGRRDLGHAARRVGS